MFCRRLTNLFPLHATIFACSKMCLCVIYVIVKCRMLVLEIYDSDSDPDTLVCWLSFAYSSIRSVSEWFTSGSNPLTDKSCKPIYHYELFCHAVKNVAVFTTNLFFLSCCYKPGVYLFRGSHDRFSFSNVKFFFRLLLDAVPEVIYSIGEDKSSLCLLGSTSDVLNI